MTLELDCEKYMQALRMSAWPHMIDGMESSDFLSLMFDKHGTDVVNDYLEDHYWSKPRQMTHEEFSVLSDMEGS